jgi:DNA end-binding protein Ku
MARPIWNGAISFGLLNVPVQLYSGERSVDLHFRMLDSRNQAPVRYERVNAETGEEVPWKDVVKGFEFHKGSYVVVDEEDIKKAAPESTETIDIESFVDRASITPLYFEKPYYLVPPKKAAKGYVLLREILEKTGRVGIAKVVIRTRQYLAALLPLGDALVLNLMRFPQEIVTADSFELPKGDAKKYRITPKEMEMATQLVESMAVDWKPADYKDDFRDKLREIVEGLAAKASGKKGKAKAESAEATPPKKSNVVDFMALLQRSLDATGKRRDSPAKKAASSKTRRRGVAAKRKHPAARAS